MESSSIRQPQLFVSPDLLVMVISYAAGIWRAETEALSGAYLQGSALLLLSLLFLINKSRLQLPSAVSLILLGFLFFLLGLLPNLQMPRPAATDNVYHLIKARQFATIEGILEKSPSVIDASEGPLTRLLVKVSALYQAGEEGRPGPNYQKTSGFTLITINGRLPNDLAPGDRLLVKARFSPVHTYSTPGSFNYKKYLANQSIFIKGWVQSPHSIIKIQAPPSFSPAASAAKLRYLPERLRYHLSLFLDQTLSQPARGLYKAILIGDRNDVPDSVLDNFARAGCLHILAISGMHMGLLALITIAVTFWILKRSSWLILHAPVLKIAVSLAFLPLSVYALIAGLNLPVLRALLMTAVFILAVIFDRPGNILNHILIAALVILIWKPWALFSASFQLSFSAVTAIALVYPLLFRFFGRKLQSGADAGADRPTAGLLQTISRLIFKWLLAGISLTAAAMLGTLPLLLFHFNRFSLAAPFSNLLVEPLICFWSLIIGLAASLAIPLSPALAESLFIAGGLGLTLADKICTLISASGYSSFWLPTPSLRVIALFYLFLISLILAWHLTGRKKQFLFISAFFFLGILAAELVITPAMKKPAAGSSVTFLDVGHGSAILLELPANKNILIDGGGNQNERFNIGERVIAPFLWHKGISRLEAVVITHPHADHYNGLPFILSRFRPERLWINGSPGQDREYNELLALADKLGIDTIIAKTDDILFQAGDTRLICLHSADRATSPDYRANPDPAFDQNDSSIVLRLETDAGAYLFTADIGAGMAEALVKKGRISTSEVLMAPHHGSSSSMSREFIQAAAPEYIVVSAGRNSSFNLPDKYSSLLEQQGVKILSTSKDGTITFMPENRGRGKIRAGRYQVN